MTGSSSSGGVGELLLERGNLTRGGGGGSLGRHEFVAPSLSERGELLDGDTGRLELGAGRGGAADDHGADFRSLLRLALSLREINLQGPDARDEVGSLSRGPRLRGGQRVLGGVRLHAQRREVVVHVGGGGRRHFVVANHGGELVRRLHELDVEFLESLSLPLELLHSYGHER